MTICLSCGIDNKTALKNEKDTSGRLAKDSSKIKTEKSIVVNTICSSDNEVLTLGIGIVIAPSEFNIYNDSLLTDKLASRNMYSEDATLQDICPIYFNPDYGIMHFVALGHTDKAYKVLINYSQIKYLPKKGGYEYKSWEDYILMSHGIRRLTMSDGDLSQPAERLYANYAKEDTLPIPAGLEMFCPIQIKGDWVKVTYDCFYNLEEMDGDGQPCYEYINECKNPITGWLRWRRGNKVLIDIFLMP
jgi:hypothetical protein